MLVPLLKLYIYIYIYIYICWFFLLLKGKDRVKWSEFFFMLNFLELESSFMA
ncbi:MAG: hypothetical protein N7Q72_01155 [Spiroplasma sp. Tabriz.8]|nr:hypothetical protein [Spiroplasma sp. Tabriz.8]